MTDNFSVEFPRVDVLLATYNGENYLQEQIESLLAQRKVHIRILVRDDGSSDRTLAILNEYSARYSDRFILLDSECRLGAIRSFEELMRVSTASYMAFCDQDDVWMPEKLEVLLGRLRELESLCGDSVPGLAHCDLKVVDHALSEISPSFWSYAGIQAHRNNFQNMLLFNTVTGCAMVCNRALIKIALPMPEGIHMHDQWLALCASAFGVIAVVDEPLVLYRQHGRNTLGAGFSLGQRIQAKFAAVISRYSYSDWSLLLRQAQIFEGARSQQLSLEKKAFLSGLLALPAKSALQRKWMLFNANIAPGRGVRRLLFWLFS